METLKIFWESLKTIIKVLLFATLIATILFAGLCVFYWVGMNL